jgi:2-oxoisovalerate dehydrogenase E2 component (dihydrolipoyl transacylase)
LSSSPTDNGATDVTSGSIEVVMPQMGVSVAEGTILSWLKQPGEEVKADETIAEVTTDKIDVEIPAPTDGVIESIEVGEGQTVAVGTTVAVISGARVTAGAEAGREEPSDVSGGADEDTEELDRSSFVSPVVRRMAEERGIDLSRIEGHGIGGRVRKRDLLDHIEGGGNGHARPLHTESPYRTGEDEPEVAEPPAPGGDELVGPSRREAMDPMRQAIARHMVASRRTAAHCTTVVEADFSAVSRERDRLKEAMRSRGVPLTYLAFVARAVVDSLAEHPILNASVEDEEIVYHEDVNLGIAVALERGLVVPVIRHAQRLSLEGLAAEIDALAGRARAGALEPDDVAGGTFTITNPGRFGAVLATPIINQPQVAILDLEAVVRRPVVIEDGEGESIGIRPMSYLCMSWDHRALDGVEAARFLSAVSGRLEGGEVQ